MSLLSTLALMVTAAFRPKLEALKDNRDARIAELEVQLRQARWEHMHAEMLVGIWRREAHANWRRQAQAVAAYEPPNQQTQYQHQLNEAMAQRNLAQAQMNMLQQSFALNPQALANQAAPCMLGSEALAPLWCNCVPSRSQVWARVTE